ncbi:MAG TPA: amidohydrolase family protein [Longimicrobium sp.]|jgi:imidazolonepropionase-like amidohydrolase|uniref:amidohydrolase family protein n=1 Tax=Longimicrobium sp. TaxID=2029185 RepID=UPI002EDA7DB8
MSANDRLSLSGPALARLARGIALAAALLASAGAVRAQQAPATLIRNARVFDGERVLDGRDVLVQDGKIAQVGRGVRAPAGATVVDGAGKTLLPGLIDAHTHTFGDALQEAVIFGVTTHLDMFTDVGTARAARQQQAAGQANGRADLFSAGTLVTAPRGHGTQFGIAIPTITRADSAQAFVDARIAEGSDWIKIVFEDGHTFGTTIPTIDRPVMRAVIEAAHRRGKLAVVHVSDASGARAALEDGADGLVHLFIDREPDADFARIAASRHAFVVPTTIVLKSMTGTGGGASLVNDPRLAPYLLPARADALAQGFPRRPGSPERTLAAVHATIRQLRAAGVPILAGTDAPNPGTAYGAAMHGELELLVEAGLTPTEALRAATSAPAAAFRLADRGRIAPGMRADLLLVEGDPTRDITATRAIVGVWKGGAAVDRASFARTVAAARARPASGGVAAVADGLVSDFESAPLAAAMGTWMPSADSFAGGTSTGTAAIADGGANGSGHSLAIEGTITATIPYAWYGAMWMPGEAMAPVDLSSRAGLGFWTRGDGGTYRVMVFARSKGMTPLIRTFVAGPEWREVRMAWSDFGIDGHDVTGVVVAGGPRPGAFGFRIDDFRLR